VVFRQYTYLNIRVRRSLLRTVSVAEGLISYEDIKINYDASRILLKYDWFQASNAYMLMIIFLPILIIIRLLATFLDTLTYHQVK
jgi:8-oxo-dGTP pyrophosphatase MutT (NUDIX family)